MKPSTIRSRLLASSMITGVALATASAGGAFAQTAPADSTKVEEFVVTGSRIPTPNLNSISPVTAVNSQEIKLSGTTRVEDLINQLPQVVGGQSGFLSISSSGTATLNLRGLGPQRNLVLIDGTRLGPGSPFLPVADLNFIPTPLVQRVDALTGGASATYGADAVAGVVNFIMKKDFTGLELTVNYDGYQHSNGDTKSQAANVAKGFPPPTGSVFDGESVNVMAVFGANTPDGKGNVEGYVGYLHTNPVTQSTRDYSNCVLAISGTSKFSCSGSGTASPANFFVNPGPLNPKYASPELSLNAAGQILPVSAANPANVFNYGAPSYYLRQDQRYQGGFFAHYDVTPHVTAYSSFMFLHDQSLAQYGPSGDFGTTVNVPCNDPQLTAQEVNQLCVIPGYSTAADPTNGTTSLAALKRNVEGGPRIDDRQFFDYRVQVGLKGDITSDWHFDVYGQYFSSTYSDNQLNFINNSRLQDVFDIVPGPGGTAVCASGNPGCVPYNIFTPGGVTKAATDYLNEPGIVNGGTTEQVVDGAITGDLTRYGGKSPFAKDGIGVSFGGEYRRETLVVSPDFANQTGGLGGNGTILAVPASAFDVKEFFAEARLPIIQDMPFVKELSADVGYRFSHYSDVGNTDTYKIGAEWAINDDIRIRGGYNRAVRAPNIQELYAPQVLTLPGSADPCANAPGVAPQYTAAQCARTGVTAAQYGNVVANSAAQYNGLTGGNPNLKPESANTYTAGVVVTPVDLVKGLSMSVDYFDIFVSNVITTYGFQNILNGCALQDNSTYCALIHRDPVSGSLWRNENGYIIDTNANLGYLKTNGIDFTFDYHFRFSDFSMPDFGGLTLNFLGTYTNKFVQQGAVGTPLTTCAGKFGPTCGPPQPFFKGKTRLTWSTPITGLQTSVDWRYIGPADVDAAGTQGRIDSHIPSYSYFDLAASYRLKDRYTFSVGVNNIFDIQPPLIGAGNADSTYSNGNTYPQVYDPLGRYLFIGVSADF